MQNLKLKMRRPNPFSIDLKKSQKFKMCAEVKDENLQLKIRPEMFLNIKVTRMRCLKYAVCAKCD